MYKEVSNQDIGQYLRKRIELKYEKQRRFCIEYIKYTNNMSKDQKPDSDTIRRESNKLNQILMGNNGIQLEDLLVYSTLLDISCEQILSAGRVPKLKNRMTNYSVGYSNRKKDWIEYMNRSDDAFLNLDEFNNSVIDYALEAENYPLIKFLLKEKYIWFYEEKNNRSYSLLSNYMAGTSVKRKQYFGSHGLETELFEKIELRKDIIKLAIKNNDIEVLNQMRAREIEEFYDVHYGLSYNRKNKPDNYIEVTYYDKELINLICNASLEVKDYFTEVIEVVEPWVKNGERVKEKFFYIAISELIDEMVKTNNLYTKKALKRALSHNQAFYKTIKQRATDEIDSRVGSLADGFDDKYKKEYRNSIKKEVFRDYFYCEDGNFVNLLSFNCGTIFTNIVKVTANSKDEEISLLIEEVNEYCNKIINLEEEFIEEE